MEEVLFFSCVKKLKIGLQRYYFFFICERKKLEKLIKGVFTHAGAIAFTRISFPERSLTASAEDTLLRIVAIDKMAAEKGIELSEESAAALEDQALAEAARENGLKF